MSSSFVPRKAAATARSFPSRSRWLRACALAGVTLFAWTMVLAAPIAALAQTRSGPRPGMRTLSAHEMQHILGQLTHDTSYSPASGPTYPWEGSADGVNTGNGNKLTSLPLVGWTQRGGLPVAFTLYHNSQGNHDSELGQKWTFSYDIYWSPAGPVRTITRISIGATI